MNESDFALLTDAQIEEIAEKVGVVHIALYKGPPTQLSHRLSHAAICLWTWSRYSHAELVIDGWCYSSSARDGGVRRKQIDLSTGRWDLFEVTGADVMRALTWYCEHEQDGYDWPGIGRWMLPFLGHAKRRWTCFESVAAMLGLAGAHRLDADDLRLWATTA